MICFVTTASHADTFKHVPEFAGVPRFRLYSYHQLLRARSVPRATWVFTDFDRLGFWELELAARIHRKMRLDGMRVLNDPARLHQRFGLLRRLHQAGYNRFDVCDIQAGEWPRRYPVFLRAQSAHRGVFSDLLPDQAALAQEIERNLARGIPRRELIAVEYCAEPARDGLFRKLAVFRVGEVMVPAICVHQSHWMAKYGERGVAGADLYEDEYRIVEENPHAGDVRPAFDLGEIEYGRADFGLVGGRPQVYEINTNPMIAVIRAHPFAIRLETQKLFERRFAEALHTIDTPDDGRRLKLKGTLFRKQRRRDRWMTKERWVI